MNPDKLAAAALAGDRRAMDKLARFLDGSLRRHFTRLRCAPDLVDDLVQRTFVTMLKNKHRFKPGGKNSFLRWVYGIAAIEVSTNRNALARTARVMAELGEVDETPERGLSSLIMLMESADMLDDEIKQLRPAQRQMVEKFLDKARGEERSPNHPNFYRLRKQLGRKLAERMNKPVPPPAPKRTPRDDTPPAS